MEERAITMQNLKQKLQQLRCFLTKHSPVLVINEIERSLMEEFPYGMSFRVLQPHYRCRRCRKEL